ncbi:MAG: hypothetical protein IT373_29765 [Polyangiaceae bacterium]|nr:hypothetical protein [Polyangiaceae bacterium]
MRLVRALLVVTVAGLGFAACSETKDDTGTGGTGTGGTGATGAGGSGGQGGEVKSPVGDACTADDQCSGDLCMPESYLGWAGGYCSGLCDPELAPCPAGSECLGLPSGGSGCIKTCSGPADCTGPAQECVDLNGDGSLLVCFGGCETDDQCEVTCNNDVLVCAQAAEVCTGGIDEDEDFGAGSGFTDCEDADCAADATCQATVAGACGGAVDVSAGGAFDGDTAGGTNAFAAVCQSLFGSYIAGGNANERIYEFTAPEAGNVSFAVAATTGSVDWYLRTVCDDGATGLGFCGTEGGATSLELASGQSVFVFVDGYGGDATFTLDVAFQAIAPICAAAQTIALGATNGNTNQGSAAMGSSCGGGGNERVYTFTPGFTGTLGLTLASASDQGLHVRGTCADSGTELGCADSQFGGTDETLDVAVTSGTAITIVVDAYSPGEEGPFVLTLAQN